MSYLRYMPAIIKTYRVKRGLPYVVRCRWPLKRVDRSSVSKSNALVLATCLDVHDLARCIIAVDRP